MIGAQELNWSVKEPWGKTPVLELYMRELQGWSTLHTAEDGEKVFPNMIAQVAAGHTPGHLAFVLKGEDYDIIFTGNAAKKRAELLSRRAGMTYNAAASAASIGMIWKLWTGRPGNILVPGHDLPMAQRDGRIEYLSEREAAIKSWFGDNLETTTLFELT